MTVKWFFHLLIFIQCEIFRELESSFFEYIKHIKCLKTYSNAKKFDFKHFIVSENPRQFSVFVNSYHWISLVEEKNRTWFKISRKKTHVILFKLFRICSFDALVWHVPTKVSELFFSAIIVLEQINLFGPIRSFNMSLSRSISRFCFWYTVRFEFPSLQPINSSLITNCHLEVWCVLL